MQLRKPWLKDQRQVGVIVANPFAWVLRQPDGKRRLFQVVVPSIAVFIAMLVLLVTAGVTAAFFVGWIGSFLIIFGGWLWVLYDTTRERRARFFARMAARRQKLAMHFRR